MSAIVKIFKHYLGDFLTQHHRSSREVLNLQSSRASFIDQNVN